MTALLSPDETFSALIFDCDGTLVDTAPSHFSALNHALGQRDLQMSAEFYRPRTGLSPQDLLAEFSAERKVVFDFEALIAVYAEAFQAEMEQLREITLVADIARAQKGRVPMAVASNGTRANVERSLATVGLRGLFDEVVAVNDVAKGKPAPDLYLEAARRLGFSPADCIVFEDTDEGVQAAQSAGMRVRDVRPHLASLPT